MGAGAGPPTDDVVVKPEMADEKGAVKAEIADGGSVMVDIADGANGPDVRKAFWEKGFWVTAPDGIPSWSAVT
jgi:hypothetical protein